MSGPRKEKGADLLRLARRLASTAEYLTKEELAAAENVSIRTLERSFAAIEGLFGVLDIETGEHGRRAFRLRLNGRDAMLSHIDASELAELNRAVEDLRRSGETDRATTLEGLAQKVSLSIKPTERNRLATDWEAILQSEALGLSP